MLIRFCPVRALRSNSIATPPRWRCRSCGSFCTADGPVRPAGLIARQGSSRSASSRARGRSAELLPAKFSKAISVAELCAVATIVQL